MGKNKIAVIVQRYGLEVNGGAELHARLISERLNEFYDVEVLTTCAIDYITWKNEYKEGSCTINGVNVRRFLVDFERDIKKFNKLSIDVFTKGDNNELELSYMKEQGPYSSGLFKYIKENNHLYYKFIFVTYLYATTFYGIKFVYNKSLLIPTAHDEPPIYLKIYREMFCNCKCIGYNDIEEKNLINKLFHNENVESEILGVGIEKISIVPNSFDIDKNIGSKYIIYVGRIDESKGCGELFEFFIRYKKETKNNIKLVLVGKNVMKIPMHKDIIEVGFVSTEVKNYLISKSEFLVLPSRFESLSMVVLESLIINKTVLVSGYCNVTKAHCLRGNCGLYYYDYYQFCEAVEFLLNNIEVCKVLSQNGEEYVRKNYFWDSIMDKFKKLIG